MSRIAVLSRYQCLILVLVKCLEKHTKRGPLIQRSSFFFFRHLFHCLKRESCFTVTKQSWRFCLVTNASSCLISPQTSHQSQGQVTSNKWFSTIIFLVLRLVHKSDFKFGTCYTQESTTCMYLTEWEGWKENISLEVRRYGPSAVALTQSMTILSYDQFLVNFHVCEGC